MLQVRDLLFGLIVEAISQASVNRMSQTHWGLGHKKSKKGGNCFVFGTKLPTRIFHQHFDVISRISTFEGVINNRYDKIYSKIDRRCYQ